MFSFKPFRSTVDFLHATAEHVLKTFGTIFEDMILWLINPPPPKPTPLRNKGLIRPNEGKPIQWLINPIGLIPGGVRYF